MVRGHDSDWFLGSLFRERGERIKAEEDALFDELNIDKEVRTIIRSRHILPTMFLKMCKKHGWDNEFLRNKFKIGDKK